ncbi:Low temperature viability protein [Glomus cerebriforme]|uniref:Low temperature viability protein n=1 Tax=Glomus cerebriforme TaxID=658196 RepID=A0A397TWK9_9GLOM|nr:Low temperature viability protein [Glomus cerebriforme]
MGKKPFIDRKNAKYFQLVHRSQRDPLINDNEASSRVLVEVVPPNLRGKDKQITEYSDFEDDQRRQKEIESRVGQAPLYGIYFDDTEYDYLQHLKPIGEGEGEAVFIESSKKERKIGGNFALKKESKSDDDKDVLSSKKDRKVKISLPKEVLPSKEELPLEFINQPAIPEDIQGFQPDMDPKLRETLEALEDDAYIKDDVDDDFFAALNAEDDEFYEEEEEDFEHDTEEIENWELEFKKFRKNKNRIKESDDDDDDKRSRTTGYSMTSSIMFRNDKLRLLDKQFEKISKEYMEEDEDIESDDESTSSQIRQDFSQILDEFLNKYEINGRKIVQKLEGDNVQDQLETMRHGFGKINVDDDNSSQNGIIKETKYKKSRDNFVHVESEEKDKRQAWDCQSILSTYSNLENHPTLIRERSHRININRKTGLPIVESSIEDNKNDEDEEIEVKENEKVNLGAARSKIESKEEKKLRKQNIKAEKKNRRIEKKSLKQAFAKERTKQTKISQNISKNHVGAIHLD